MTRDHSLVEDLVQRGELTREQARTHPHKNLITQALGAEPELRAVCSASRWRQDYLLLCGDGLSNVVSGRSCSMRWSMEARRVPAAAACWRSPCTGARRTT